MHKALHITTVHTPFDPRVFYRECQSLTKDFDVSLLCNIDHEKVVGNVKLIPLKNKHFVAIKPFLFFSRIAKAIYAYKKALKTKADIYHIHDPELLPVALRLKRKTNAVVIFDSHEDNRSYMKQKEYLPTFLKKIFSFFVSYYEKKAAQKLDTIITADEGVERYFNKNGAKTQIIHNFPRIDYFDHNPDSALQKEFDLVYHGSIPKYLFKNILAIDKKLTERGYYLKWYLFGIISGFDWAKEQVTKLKHPERFKISHRIPHDIVATEVKKAKIGLIPLPNLPKFQSNIPTKLFEFMYMSMPVVLSDLPPSRTFVKNCDCAFLVNPSNFEGFAEKIIYLINNPEKAKEMGLKGKEKVIKLYNWDTESKKLTALYKRLLNNK